MVALTSRELGYLLDALPRRDLEAVGVLHRDELAQFAFNLLEVAAMMAITSRIYLPEFALMHGPRVRG